MLCFICQHINILTGNFKLYTVCPPAASFFQHAKLQSECLNVEKNDSQRSTLLLKVERNRIKIQKKGLFSPEPQSFASMLDFMMNVLSTNVLLTSFQIINAAHHVCLPK